MVVKKLDAGGGSISEKSDCPSGSNKENSGIIHSVMINVFIYCRMQCNTIDNAENN